MNMMAVVTLKASNAYPVGYTRILYWSMEDHDSCIESWSYEEQTYWSLGLGGSLYSDARDYITANCDYHVELNYMLWNAGWPITNGTCNYESWDSNDEGNTYSSGACYGTGVAAPLTFAVQYNKTYYHYDDVWFGDDVTFTYNTDISTTVYVDTGGPVGSTRPCFIKLHGSATDEIAHTGISGTSLTLGGYQCDAGGYAYRSGADNQTYDATVAAHQNGYSNYTFSAIASTAHLQIWRGSDITDQTNTVIVGEQIALTCRFDDQDIAPITNFQWTVPGNTISNWDGSGTASILLTDYAKTNSAIYYHWVQAGTLLEVQCTAIAKGVSLTAKTKFNVLAPTYSLSICSSNSVTVDSTYLPGTSGDYMHFGVPPNAPGVVLRASPGTLVQSSNDFNLDIYQVINSLTAKRWSNGILQVLSVTNVRDDGLGVFPIGTVEIGSNDSPGERALSTYAGVSRNDSFSAYVMYQSATSGSIWVPLTVASWSWSGTATNNGGWTLTSSNFVPATCLSGSSTTTFPFWTNLFSTVSSTW